MARLSVLLRLARRSDRNRVQGAATKAGKLFEVVVSLALAFLCVNLLLRAGFGPTQARDASAHQLWGVLAAFLLFLPLSSSPSMDASVLAIRPVSRKTLRWYRVLAPWTSYRSLVVVVFTLASLATSLRLQQPIVSGLTALAIFSTAILLASAISLGNAKAKQHGWFPTGKKRSRGLHRWPLFRKDLHSSIRLLDPWVTLLASLLLGATEISGRWLNPTAVSIGVLLGALLYLPMFLLPFCLDTSSELVRQQLLPLRISDLVTRKYGAAAVLWGIVCLPLGLMIGFTAGLTTALSYSVYVLVTLGALLLAGGLLFRKVALLRIRLTAGNFAGNSLPMDSFLFATALPVLAVSLQVLLSRYADLWSSFLFAIVLLLVLSALSLKVVRSRMSIGLSPLSGASGDRHHHS